MKNTFEFDSKIYHNRQVVLNQIFDFTVCICADYGQLHGEPFTYRLGKRLLRVRKQWINVQVKLQLKVGPREDGALGVLEKCGVLHLPH